MTEAERLEILKLAAEKNSSVEGVLDIARKFVAFVASRERPFAGVASGPQAWFRLCGERNETPAYPDGTKVVIDDAENGYLLLPGGERVALVPEKLPRKPPDGHEMKRRGMDYDRIFVIKSFIRTNAGVPADFWWDLVNQEAPGPSAEQQAAG